MPLARVDYNAAELPEVPMPKGVQKSNREKKKPKQQPKPKPSPATPGLPRQPWTK
jgi:hypothetical protein